MQFVFLCSCQFYVSAMRFIFAHEAETLSWPPSQCPSSGEILSHFGISNLSRLTVGDLETICPAVLTQVLLPSCPHIVAEDGSPRLDYSGQLLHRFVCPALASQTLGRSERLVCLRRRGLRGCGPAGDSNESVASHLTWDQPEVDSQSLWGGQKATKSCPPSFKNVQKCLNHLEIYIK